VFVENLTRFLFFFFFFVKVSVFVQVLFRVLVSFKTTLLKFLNRQKRERERVKERDAKNTEKGQK